MSTCERVSLLDAARELGMNPQGLREYMKRGLIDIGLVLPNSKGTAAGGCGGGARVEADGGYPRESGLDRADADHGRSEDNPGRAAD